MVWMRRLLDGVARANSTFGRMSELPWTARQAITLGVFALIAWIDFATANYVSVTGFYLLPIVLAARYGDEGTLGLVLGLSTTVSLYMAELAIPPDAPAWSKAMSYCSVLLFFGGIGVLVWRVRDAYARLEKASRTDPLTGLANRRAFADALALEIGRARRRGTAYAVALVDLDHFKRVNDSHGHHAGDALLSAVAACMTDALRQIDVVARLGGDEFAIVLPGAGRDEAEAVAARLLARLREVLAGYAEFGVTASIGVVAADGAADAAQVEDILRTADAAMYAVKNGSRNSVRVVDAAGGAAAPPATPVGTGG
jgi:diguanylate cyclase (GGDEF)-like protein